MQQCSGGPERPRTRWSRAETRAFRKTHRAPTHDEQAPSAEVDLTNLEYSTHKRFDTLGPLLGEEINVYGQTTLDVNPFPDILNYQNVPTGKYNNRIPVDKKYVYIFKQVYRIKAYSYHITSTIEEVFLTISYPGIYICKCI